MTNTHPEPRFDLDWWKDRHQEKLVAVGDAADCELLFVGDSITHSWEDYGATVWSEYFAHRKPFNLGYSGDRTQHVLWRLANGELGVMQPKVAVLLIGTNNTGHEFDEAVDTAAGVKVILEKLRDHSPETKILLLAVFPRSEQPSDPLRLRNDEVNAMISEFADGERVRFLDVGDGFVHDNGVLRVDLLPDLLHPREKGYRIWAEAMEPTLSGMLGE